jgi:hypothetical protein
MKKRRFILRLASFALACIMTGGLIAVYATSKAGTAEDPLVTLSYIEKVFQPQILNAVDQAAAEAKQVSEQQIRPLIDAYLDSIDQKIAELTKSAGTIAQNPFFVQMVQEAVEEKLSEIEVIQPSQDALYKSVSLPQGKTLKAGIGCEVILRTGAATVSAAGFTNLSKSGTALAVNAAVPQNNSLIAVTAGASFRATQAATVLVRGPYTIQ